MAERHEQWFRWDGGYGSWRAVSADRRATPHERRLLEECERLVDERNELRAQVLQFHRDWEDRLLAAMYGERPGGWNADRQDAFERRLSEAEERHREYARQLSR